MFLYALETIYPLQLYDAQRRSVCGRIQYADDQANSLTVDLLENKKITFDAISKNTQNRLHCAFTFTIDKFDAIKVLSPISLTDQQWQYIVEHCTNMNLFAKHMVDDLDSGKLKDNFSYFLPAAHFLDADSELAALLKEQIRKRNQSDNYSTAEHIQVCDKIEKPFFDLLVAEACSRKLKNLLWVDYVFKRDNAQKQKVLDYQASLNQSDS